MHIYGFVRNSLLPDLEGKNGSADFDDIWHISPPALGCIVVNCRKIGPKHTQALPNEPEACKMHRPTINAKFIVFR